jgi:hypothetical protein
MPWGLLASGYAASTGSTSGVTTATDVTGMTCTPTLVANRIYRVSYGGNFLQSTSAGNAQLLLVVGGSTKDARAGTQPASNYFTAQGVIYLSGLAAGATTFKCQITTSAGTVGTNFAATQPGIIMVEDVGPSANPA